MRRTQRGEGVVGRIESETVVAGVLAGGVMGLLEVIGSVLSGQSALLPLRNDATAAYWCLPTMSPAGPDDGLVHARRCGPGRVCCTIDAVRDEV